MADGATNPLPVPTGAAKTPSDFLKSIRGKPVIVKLNSGVDYRGMLFTRLMYDYICAGMSLQATTAGVQTPSVLCLKKHKVVPACTAAWPPLDSLIQDL